MARARAAASPSTSTAVAFTHAIPPNAETDVTMRAQILTYSRARGLFAGISLEGSTVRPDNDANGRVYGKQISAKEIVLHNVVPIPAAAKNMIRTLNEHSPKHS